MYVIEYGIHTEYDGDFYKTLYCSTKERALKIYNELNRLREQHKVEYEKKHLEEYNIHMETILRMSEIKPEADDHVFDDDTGFGVLDI